MTRPLRPVRRTATAVALLVVSGLLVSGCGGASEASYCKALKSDQSVFADDGTGLQLITNLPKLESLAAKAPDDIDDEWQAFTAALESLRDAITKAHTQPKDFVDGKPPAGLAPADVAAISAAANELSDPDVLDAANGIEQEAKDVCQFQLGL
ncbi:MAG: hypothetical protein JWP74_2790 [Marmoricola sp.]|nr:hypothetical protein [Marmoricola sp.]